MASLYILIPIALIFCVIVIRLLLWAIDNGQYDDLDKEAWRILAEEKKPEQPQAPGPTPTPEQGQENNDH